MNSKGVPNGTNFSYIALCVGELIISNKVSSECECVYYSACIGSTFDVQLVVLLDGGIFLSHSLKNDIMILSREDLMNS